MLQPGVEKAQFLNSILVRFRAMHLPIQSLRSQKKDSLNVTKAIPSSRFAFSVCAFACLRIVYTQITRCHHKGVICTNDNSILFGYGFSSSKVSHCAHCFVICVFVNGSRPSECCLVRLLLFPCGPPQIADAVVLTVSVNVIYRWLIMWVWYKAFSDSPVSLDCMSYTIHANHIIRVPIFVR